jgi:transposase-like protein
MGEVRECLKLEVVQELLGGKISRKEAVQRLGVSRVTLFRYVRGFWKEVQPV